MDVAWTVGKLHPYRENRTGPVWGRDCCVSFNTIQSVLIPTYKRILPREPALLSGVTKEGKPRRWPGLKGGKWQSAWSEQDKMLYLDDSSFIEFKSYEQGREALQGAARHIVRMDEEPTEVIFMENMARQFTTGTNIIFTMTPLNYSQWIYGQIFEGAAKHDHIECFRGSSIENPHIDKEALRMLEESCTDPAERAARLHGESTFLHGRVLKEYGDHNLIDFFQPPSQWKRTLVLDPHEDKPTAANWFAYDPMKEKHYGYKEAELEGDVEQICTQLRALSSGERIDDIIMDPSARREAKIPGKGRMIDEFRSYLGVIVEANNNVSVGLDTLRKAVRQRPSGPQLYIMRSCPTTDHQLRNTSWKRPLVSGEDRSKPQISKRHDDHFDNSRYYFMSCPATGGVEFEGFGVSVYAN